MVNYLNSRSCPDSLFYKLEELTDQNNIIEAVSYIQKHFKCNNEVANQVYTEYKKQIYNELKRIDDEIKSSLTPQQIAHANAIAREWQNKPKCPICGSTNINKITLGSRAVKTAVFGIVGTVDDAGKTYKCGNCGSKF